LLGTSAVIDASPTSSPTSSPTNSATSSTTSSTRLRRHRGVALRAGAGAAALLGVTAGITLLTGQATGQPPVAEAADLLTAPPPEQAAKAAQDRVPQRDAGPNAHRIAAANRSARVAAANRAARAHAIALANRAARAAAAHRAVVAAAAKQRAAAAAASVSRSSSRAPRSAARALLAARGWSGQFGCLDSLWQRESGWNYRAYNASSGAAGIPQALPGSKMASAGADWRTNPVTQIRWGLSYIASTYGTPCGAWAHSQAAGWY
jgi:hypothetical protein